MCRDIVCGRTLLHSLYCLTLNLRFGMLENMTETNTTEKELNETHSTKSVIDYDSTTHLTQPSTTTGAPKIPVCEGLLLLSFISACLIAGAFIYALLLWIASKVYYFNGDEQQTAAAPERMESLQVPEEKAEPLLQPLQQPERRAPVEKLHHALDNKKSHSLEEVTFDLDPDELKDNGPSKDYMAINAVYRPPTKKEKSDNSNPRTAKIAPAEQEQPLRSEDLYEESDKKKQGSEKQLSTHRSKSDLLLSPPSTPRIVPQSEKGSDTQRTDSGAFAYTERFNRRSSKAVESSRKPLSLERYSNRTNMSELLLPLEEVE